MQEESVAPIRQPIVYKELFKDRPLVVLMIGGVVLMLVTVVRVLLSIKHYDIHIPVRYTQFGQVDSYISGDWYSHYGFAVFAVVILAVNTLIALRIYRHRRWVSLAVLSAQLVVFFFLIVVSGAIINTLPVAG